MKLGFVSAILPELNLEELLSFASQNGYSCVEVACWPKGKAERRYAGVTHVDVTDAGPKDAARIKELVGKYGVEISSLGYYPNALTSDETAAKVFIDHLKKVIQFSALLGLNLVTTFVGREVEKNLAYNLEKLKRVWTPIVKLAEDQGVRIGIENCPMFFSNDEWPNGANLAYSPAIWREMFSLIPSKSFGLNYDPSHLLWQQMDYVAPLYEFKDRIFHVHFKDAKINRDRLNDVGILATPLEYHQPKLPGLGEVSWGRYISALTDIGYRGPACVEAEDRSFEDSLESRKRALVQARNFLIQFLPL